MQCMNLPTSTHALHFHQWWIDFGNPIQTKENFPYEYYLEQPMKAELFEMDTSFRKMMHRKLATISSIGDESRYEDNSSFILGFELWIWFICCVNQWHWCVGTTSATLSEIFTYKIEKSLHKDWDIDEHTVPSCSWTCKDPWR